MSVTAIYTQTVRRTGALAVPALAAPVVVYVISFLVRVAAAAVVTFPLNEGSAYYVDVARSLAAGRGPFLDSIWSYSTPPLTLPRPAFELWQPLASVIAAWPMTLFGPTFNSAQLGFAAVGALLAPLAWLVARDAASRLDLPDNRQRWVAVGAGLLTAVAGPFVLSAVIPDSTLPFTVLTVAACVAMPAAAQGKRFGIVALGLLLGLAYLTRMEAIYVGVVFVAFAWQAGARRARLFGRVGAVALIGALVALPWWLRNLSVFGSAMPGQISDNVFLTSNDQIFNYVGRPSLADFTWQGVVTIVANIVAAAWHQAVDVLLLPGNVIVVAGFLAAVFGWRRRAAISGSPLAALLVYGALCFAFTALVFPVATLWGTFEHAAGALLVGFAVLAVLGADAFVARVRQWRKWPRPNAGMAPAGLAALALAMTMLQLALAGVQATARDKQISDVADTLRQNGIIDGTTPVVTDRPLWLNDATGSPTLVLPRQDATVVGSLANRFDARYVVLVDGPTHDLSACFSPVAVSAPASAPDLTVFQATGACR